MRQRKKASEEDVKKRVTSVSYWSSVLLRTSVGGQYRTVQICPTVIVKMLEVLIHYLLFVIG